MPGAAALRLVWACLLGGGLALAVGRVGAQPAGLPAVVNAGGSGLDAAAIQSAVERELGVALSIDPNASERLEITLTGRRANVTYYRAQRDPVTRSVDLPRDDQRALATIAFLAGNLARDEAAELLKQLAPAPADGEPDEVPRPEPPPPPPPAPVAPASVPPKPAPSEKSGTEATASALIEPKPFAANASLFHPVTILDRTEQRRLNFELGLAYSRVGAIRGAALTLGYLRVDGPVEGFSYALVWNRSGPVTGLQLASFVNQGFGTLKGLSYADLVNVRDGDVFGVHASAIYARAAETRGVELAGIFAHASGIEGAQAGGLVSYSGDVRGAQAAGLLSIAKDVRGVQVAGLVSVAKVVRGLQLGVINVADEIHGGAIGLISIAKNGRVQPTAWVPGPNAGLVLGIKSVTDLTYSQIGIGYDPFQRRFRNDLGAGLHFELGSDFYLETGIGYDETYKLGDGNKAFVNDSLVRSQLRYDARVGFEPIRGVTPFVGGALTRRMDGGGANFRGEYCFGLSFL
jgi:hypothetical protein